MWVALIIAFLSVFLFSVCFTIFYNLEISKRTSYRIKQIGNDCFYPQYKGRYFWHNFDEHNGLYCYLWYDTLSDAKSKLNSLIVEYEEEEQIKEERKTIKKYHNIS